MDIRISGLTPEDWKALNLGPLGPDAATTLRLGDAVFEVSMCEMSHEPRVITGGLGIIERREGIRSISLVGALAPAR